MCVDEHLENLGRMFRGENLLDDRSKRFDVWFEIRLRFQRKNKKLSERFFAYIALRGMLMLFIQS